MIIGLFIHRDRDLKKSNTCSIDALLATLVGHTSSARCKVWNLKSSHIRHRRARGKNETTAIIEMHQATYLSSRIPILLEFWWPKGTY